MSVTLTLFPLVVAISTSVSATTTGLLLNSVQSGENSLPAVPTIFNDAELLIQTLNNHGLEIQKQNDNDFVVETDAGILHYFKNTEAEAFQVEVTNVRDIGALLESLDELENEYGNNVQRYTYDRVIEGLAEHGMEIDSEEIGEDNSIVLRLNVL